MEPQHQSPVTGTAAGRRWRSLDALRGLAVVLMIEQHLGVWLWRGPAPGQSTMDYPILVAFNALGGAAAPLFVTLAGMGSALLAASASARHSSPDRTMILRGAGVICFGYLLSFLTPSWFTWRSWFVLHLMGAGMVLGPLWRRLQTPLLLLLAVVCLGATPWMQDWFVTPARLHNPRMAGWAGSVGGDVLEWAPIRLALVEGQFPIFPWMAFFVCGVASGRWLYGGRRGRIVILALVSLVSGSAFAVCFHVLRVPWFVEHWRAFRVPVPFFPASPTFVLLLLGVVLSLVALATSVELRRGWGPRRPMVTLGRVSLTLLIVHVVIFREFTRPIGLWQGMGAGLTLLTLIGFTCLSWILSRVWERHEYRYGAEWMLRRLA